LPGGGMFAASAPPPPPPATVPDDDVIVHATGGTLAAEPLQVEGGDRTAFLYDVTRDDRGDAGLRIAVGLRNSVRIAGVFGGAGTAAGWADSLAGTTLTQIVPDEQLTPNGAARVRLVRQEQGGRHG
jgi:hypothetical protein